MSMANSLSQIPSIGAHLPQEIIDLIIDNVASMKDKNYLRACALVSRAFLGRSRHHLFMNIEVVVDGSTQKRSGRLRKVLQSNPTLVLGIRSFRIYIPNTPPKSKLERKILRTRLVWLYRHTYTKMVVFGRKLGLLRNHFLWLLQTISRAPVETLAVKVEPPTLDWNVFSKKMRALLLTIRSNSSLKTLELSSLHDLPASMILATLGNGNTLQNLLLHSCAIAPWGTPLFKSDLFGNFVIPPSFRQLQRLEIKRLPFRNFFSQALEFSPSFGDASSPISIPLFPGLLSLTLDIPSYRRDNAAYIWQFMMSGSRSIKSLEIKIPDSSTFRRCTRQQSP
ncbi:hypothetical protein BDZ97DRAFT_686035 [Flammula alnicola]|nr:hypothetical protein BDZ97DRAFT_686035 [Flammula alnicola]